MVGLSRSQPSAARAPLHRAWCPAGRPAAPSQQWPVRHGGSHYPFEPQHVFAFVFVFDPFTFSFSLTLTLTAGPVRFVNVNESVNENVNTCELQGVSLHLLRNVLTGSHGQREYRPGRILVRLRHKRSTIGHEQILHIVSLVPLVDHG